MDISVIDRESRLDGRRKRLLVAETEKTLRHLGLSDRSQVCLSFVSDADMRKLNKRYRAMDRTTDVLSFAQPDVGGRGLLGDVVISYDTAVRNSERFSVAVDREIRRLVVHGILHLLGFDHAKKKQREIMRGKESEILGFLEREG